METYYLYTNDPIVAEFVLQMARNRKARMHKGFPNGYFPGCANSLLIYDKYLNKYSQYNGRDEIIKYVRSCQFKAQPFSWF